MNIGHRLHNLTKQKLFTYIYKNIQHEYSSNFIGTSLYQKRSDPTVNAQLDMEWTVMEETQLHYLHASPTN